MRLTLPELRLPEQYRHIVLPPVVDNSTQPYWRPIFNQSSASCGQAAGVAYNFTYEMCRHHNRDASLPQHQFPSHFVYNFMNYNGYYGVNYYHSFEILRTLGTPTIAEYGGMAIDDGNKWISGYDFYRSAMRNRIKAVHRIKTHDVEGLNTLKHWLAHHLDGSTVGGVANFNAASPWGLQSLPPGTPEAGKLVMPQFQGHQATHAMTIVGYNDSIRWDYNGDGQYTNHLDINGDGVVNLLDYEIGAFKVGNSYSDTWANGGYCYMMYRLLAEDVYYGGIWNQQVEVLELNQPYEPLLTMKLVLKHNMREQLRINAGVSADTADLIPAHRLMFPVFNFQGGPQFMQGGTTDPLNQYIEIGLDLTPLLNHIDSGQPAKFFLEILENDSLNTGFGEIISYAIRDYTSGQPQEIPCAQINIPLAHNTTTRLSIVHAVGFDDVQITTPYLPPFNAGHQLGATGGTPPYTWSIRQNYHQQKVTRAFPQAQQQQLQPESPNNRFARKTIDFEFPFYGEKFSEIFMHRDGFLLFGPELFPWPYYKDTYLLFRTMKNIAVFLVSPIQYYPGTKGSEGMWYEGDASHATFRWKKPIIYFDRQIGYGEFAVTLYPDGRIDYDYADLSLTEPVLWYAGVSAGEQKAFNTIKGSGTRTVVPAGKSFTMLPDDVEDGISLTPDGYLSGNLSNPSKISNIVISAEDSQGLTDTRTFQLADLIQFGLTARKPSGGQPVAGEEIVFDLWVRNLSSTQLDNVVIHLGSGSSYLQLTHQAINTTLAANGVVQIPAAFTGMLSQLMPDGYYIPVSINFATPLGVRSGTFGFEVKAMEIIKISHGIDDEDNKRLDPGETAPLSVTLANTGSLPAQLIELKLESFDPYVSVNEYAVELANLSPGSETAISFMLSASPDCPVGRIARLRFSATKNGDTLISVPVYLKIGQYPLFVFLRSSAALSSEVVRNTLDQLAVPYVFGTSLPDSLSDFRAVIACLGGVNSSGSLSSAQAERLAKYLNGGGRLYLEGATIWAFNRPPLLYEKFSVNGIYLSPAIPVSTIVGVDKTFTENMSFAYFNPSAPYVFFEVAPLGNAFALLKPENFEQHTVMTGLENSQYKTIASTVEFGHLGDAEAHEPRQHLMMEILKFFGLGNLVTSNTEIRHDKTFQILLSPNPATDKLNIAFQTESDNLITLTIYTATGTSVASQRYTTTAGQHMLSVDVSSLRPGVYLLQAKSDQNLVSTRFIKH
ncbi:MAG TPA: T9SS type A sorting domain-containing protein [Bacteroidales bacterium]|nr:T9SS type A sorting domain-containing protein [Bacteroidales bacterium]